MRLVYLPVNAAWTFLFGDAPVRIGSGPLLFARRADAVTAARAVGLAVGVSGVVAVAGSGRPAA